MKKDESLSDIATAALRDAVDKVIEEHRQRGRPLAIWRDGQVVMLPPEEAKLLREERASYGNKAP
jgi:hypothetical protein